MYPGFLSITSEIIPLYLYLKCGGVTNSLQVYYARYHKTTHNILTVFLSLLKETKIDTF